MSTPLPDDPGPPDEAPTPGEADGGSTPDSTAVVARCAVFAGLCSFVPVPFLDDILIGRAHRHLVASLLALHGRTTPLEAVRPLYGGKGCLEGACAFVIGLPIKLVIKAIQKLVRTILFVLAVRTAALAMSEVLLLGRCVERCLQDGRLPADAGEGGPHGPGQPTWDASARLRAAFAVAFARADLRLLGALFSGVLRGIAGLRWLARDVVRRLFRRGAEVPAGEDLSRLPAAEQEQVQAVTRRVVQALDQPEAQRFLSEFDARFDDAWAAPRS